MNSKENVKLILKGTPIRLNYTDYEDREDREIIRLNDVSEIKFVDGNETLCVLNKSFIVYEKDDDVTFDDELLNLFADMEDYDLDAKLSLGTEEVEFIASIGKDSIDNILLSLPLELDYTEIFHNKIIMNDILWSKQIGKGKKGYSHSCLNFAPRSIPENNSKGEQFWNVITKCHYDE